MPTLLLPATLSSLPTLASIYRQSFAPGELYTSLFGQCPPEQVEARMVKRMRGWVENPKEELWMATNEEGECVGLAYWGLPGPVGGWGDASQEGEGEGKKREWGEGVNVEVAQDFFKRLDEHSARLPKRSFHLEMLCTSPLHQRTGAARLFLQHLAAQADAEGLEIYLDATKEGLPVYPRFGYELVQGFEPIVACDGSFSVHPMVRKPGNV